ncbi:MAG TPA: DMT family transporter [Oscillospiraceae bacterium]|nr:DMT family transporter [Oscillospiraceae bacterium]
MIQTEKKAAWVMLLCAVFWSIGGIFIKLIPWNALVIAGVRSLIAAGILLIYMHRTGVRFVLNRYSLASGAALGGTMLLFVSANKLTTSANAIVLQYTARIFVLVISALFFREKLKRRDIVVGALVFAGITLFFFDSLTPGGILGNVLAILSGVSFASTMVISGRSDNDSCMSGILVAHFLTSLVGLPFLFVFDTPVTGTTLVCMLVLGVFQLGIPYILYGYAIRRCPPFLCSIISLAEPMLNPVWVFLFDGETPGIFALFGAVIVISAVAWRCLKEE